MRRRLTQRADAWLNPVGDGYEVNSLPDLADVVDEVCDKTSTP